MERLDEARNSCDSGVEDPETAPSMLIQAPKQPPAGTLPFQKGLVTTPDDLAAAESKQKWPLSLAARPAMWEGLDTQGLSATSSRGATSRRVQGHLGLRRLPGQPLGPFERDKLLDSFNQFRQNGGHLPSMASSTSHFSRGVDLLDVQSHDMEALQQRCAELEALVTELKRSKRRTSKPSGTSSTVSLPGTPGGLTCTAPSTAADPDEDLSKMTSRAEQAEQRVEVLAAELAAASARLAEAEDGANAKVAAAAASLRASEAACLAAVEAAQDATEARRRVEEELAKEAAAAKRASSNELAEAAAARAAVQEASRAQELARSRASAMQKLRGDSHELAMLASCFATWRLWLADSRINCARDAMEVQWKEVGRVARQRVRHGMQSALKSTEIEVMHTVIAAWRTSLCTRRTVGSLQAALFAEEADRASALRAQRSECDVLLLQAEARHRIALQKLRSELAEAQAKQKEASAAEHLALQAAVRAESIGWPSLDMPDTEDGAATEHPSSPETE